MMTESGILLPDSPALFVPARTRPFDVAPRVHNLSDELLRARMSEYLLTIVGPNYYACVIFANGSGALIPHTREVAEYEGDKREYLKTLVERANRGCHHGGAWIGVLKDRSRLSMLWKDRDGDVVAAHEDQQPWPRMKGVPIDDYVEACEGAIQAYRRTMREMDVRDDQTIKRALGQNSVTQH